MKRLFSLISLVMLLFGGVSPVSATTLQEGADAPSQIFIYSPGERNGLHVAYLTENAIWKEIGQLCSSDYSQWGSEKRMYNPNVTRASDGTWRLVFGVNDNAPCFAAAYSEDLITWRPQDYPRMSRWLYHSV